MKKPKFRMWMKAVISIFMVVVLLTVSYLVSYSVFKESPLEVYAYDIAISSEDPKCYYLKKASPDIAFQIINDSANDPYRFELSDSEEKEVDVVLDKNDGKNSFIIKAPSSGYEPGETYTLVLADNTYFADSDLANARKLIFTIAREEIEHYKFTDEVVEVDGELIPDEAGKLILPEGQSLQQGDIAFGKDGNGDYNAYKIVSVNNNTAEIETPGVDEIYEELLIYTEFEWDVNEIAANPNLEREVIDNLVSSEFYDNLMDEAYGEDVMPVTNTVSDSSDAPSYTTLSNSGDDIAVTMLANDSGMEVTPNSISYEDFEFSYEADEDANTISFDVTIPIQAGKGGLFGIEELESHAIKLNLSCTIGCDTYLYMDGVKNWDLAYTITSDFSWSIDLNLINGEITEDPDLDDLFKNSSLAPQYHKMVKQISQKLDSFSKDYGKMELELFEWEIPIASVPGIVFEIEVELAFTFEISADMTIGNSHSSIYKAGLYCRDGKFDSYSNEYTSESSPTLSVRGTLGTKLGMQLEMQLCLIDDGIAYIGITPQVGGYFDAYVLAPIMGSSDFDAENGLYAYAETGVYMQIAVDAYLNLLLVDDLQFGPIIFEKKWTLPKDGFGSSQIVFGIEPSESVVFTDNGEATVPNFTLEYYDVTGGVIKSEILTESEYTLYDENGNTINTIGDKIDVPDSMGEAGMVIRAQYYHDNDKSYEAEFTITNSRSVIEGRVSAFNRGNHTALSGANVSLYKADNPNDSIASKTTGSDGAFSFNVAPGTYKLKISAQGYKTLSTTQTVSENETKYTEHLLLLDDTMDGLGSASGTVSDALNGRGISGVTIKLREEWNNSTGDYVENFSTTTNSSGQYVIEGLPIGYYTLEATVNGYITTHSNILVLDDRDLVDFDFAMTPVLEEGTVRIILNWGASPSDLDSHLIGKTPSGGNFNVYYGDKHYHNNGVEMANLDYDDTSGYGPETITVLEDINGTYTYAVHDYSNRNSSNSNAMSYSGARVRVLIGGRDGMEEFYVPTNRTGVYWTVFKIDSNYNVIPVNTVSNVKPTP